MFSLTRTWCVHPKCIRVINASHEKILEGHVALTLGIHHVTSKSRDRAEWHHGEGVAEIPREERLFPVCELISKLFVVMALPSK